MEWQRHGVIDWSLQTQTDTGRCHATLAHTYKHTLVQAVVMRHRFTLTKTLLLSGNTGSHLQTHTGTDCHHTTRAHTYKHTLVQGVITQHGLTPTNTHWYRLSSHNTGSHLQTHTGICRGANCYDFIGRLPIFRTFFRHYDHINTSSDF